MKRRHSFDGLLASLLGQSIITMLSKTRLDVLKRRWRLSPVSLRSLSDKPDKWTETLKPVYTNGSDSIKKVVGLNPLGARGLSLWSLHVLQWSVWVLSRYSSFRPQLRHAFGIEVISLLDGADPAELGSAPALPANLLRAEAVEDGWMDIAGGPRGNPTWTWGRICKTIVFL